MVDQKSQDAASQPVAGAPANRDRRQDPGVIEGETAAQKPTPEDAPSAVDEGVDLSTAAESETPAPPLSPPAGKRPPGAAGAFSAGALGGLIVAATHAPLGLQGARTLYLGAAESDAA